MAKKAAKKESATKAPKAVAVEKPVKKAAKPASEKPEKAEKVVKAAKPAAEKAEAVPKQTAKAKRAEAARVAAAAEADARWTELKEKHGKDKAPKYSMTGQFAANTPLEHSKLGWGFVVNNVNDRLEVLFQEGIKILISNYNPDQKI